MSTGNKQPQMSIEVSNFKLKIRTYCTKSTLLAVAGLCVVGIFSVYVFVA